LRYFVTFATSDTRGQARTETQQRR
jgi:hypothetical protein